ARVGGFNDFSSKIDTADERVLAQDLALTGRGERIFVVDRGVTDFHDELARGQIVERDRFELAGGAAFILVDAKSGKGWCGHGWQLQLTGKGTARSRESRL